MKWPGFTKLPKRAAALLSAACLFSLNGEEPPPVQEEYAYPEYDYANFTGEELLNDSEDALRVIMEPQHRTYLSGEVQAPVVKIYKKMGDSFSKGDVLIKLDDTIFKANLKQAQAGYERAKVEYEGKKELYNDNVASLFELKEAEANLSMAEATVIIARKNFEATSIDAPYDGKVVSLGIEEYELSTQGTQLIEIVDDSVLLAKFLIPSTMLQQVKVGTPINIRIEETGDEITGTVARIGAVIDPSSSTIRIEVEVDNKDDKYRAGMTGIARFDETLTETKK